MKFLCQSLCCRKNRVFLVVNILFGRAFCKWRNVFFTVKIGADDKKI